ncbi:MAG: type I restriction-modification system subunit M [Coriobacteriia bacterium]|nr:type I restriction-modification system subunit M [Coriobacteriia bacterium]
MTEYSREELEKVLWAAADSSRSNLDAGVYKDYVLAMLFYKYISDQADKQYQEYLKRSKGDAKRAQAKMKNSRFNLPVGTAFADLYAKREEDNIGEDLNKALKAIEDANREKLGGVFAVDFNSEVTLGKIDQRNKMIRNLLADFNKIDFAEQDPDIIGDAYMYMIEHFGSDAGKKAGEFFTRRSVAELVARLVRPEPGSRICDPACGSGGLLLLAGAEVKKQKSKDYALYGQESNGSTYQLCRMNIFLHDEDAARIEWGDTLNNPLLVEGGHLMKFDICVANPPFSLDKWGAENAADDRYKRFWRGVPPKSTGDYAFITHMVETLQPRTGRMAVIVPHGVLFRSGAEGKIRRALLKENLIDAVIGLPAGLFQTTSIPVAVLVIDKAREAGGAREGDKSVLFIEASKEFKPGKAINTLEPDNANRIFDTFVARKEVEKFAHLAPPEEITENDYNLNITRYVDTFEEEPEVDIEATIKELEDLNPELEKLETQMQQYLRELGIGA